VDPRCCPDVLGNFLWFLILLFVTVSQSQLSYARRQPARVLVILGFIVIFAAVNLGLVSGAERTTAVAAVLATLLAFAMLMCTTIYFLQRMSIEAIFNRHMITTTTTEKLYSTYKALLWSRNIAFGLVAAQLLALTFYLLLSNQCALGETVLGLSMATMDATLSAVAARLLYSRQSCIERLLMPDVPPIAVKK